MRRFVLASASPARLGSLRAAGFSPEVIVSGVDEDGVPARSVPELVGALARLKCEAVAARPAAAGALVLGCDSLLEFDGAPRGKPADAAAAVELWSVMRGRAGVLHSGHHLVDNRTGRHAAGVSSTAVHFGKDITDAEIEAYVATGEPTRVAGGFTMDGFGAPFVSRIEGDPGTVIGVSLPLLRGLLAELGIALTDLWVRP